MNDRPNAEVRIFSLGFRITVAFFALLSGLLLALWASDQGEYWKWLPSVGCLIIAGAAVLPGPIAVVCGYIISASILTACVWVLYQGLSGEVPLINAVRFVLIYGTPALAYLFFRRLRFGKET